MSSPKLYRVLTWDSERQAFTPQRGVRSGPYTLFGLRRPLRKLRTMGYAGRPLEPCVVCVPWVPGETVVRA